FWARVWAGCVLGPTEREQFRALRTPEPRRVEWLAGRSAAKDAVRGLLREQHGLDLAPADIEIVPDEQGRPTVQGAWLTPAIGQVAVSIAHRAGWAVAVAGLHRPGERGDQLHLGIDLESRTPLPADVVETAFDASERAVIGTVGAELRDDWVLRCWC